MESDHQQQSCLELIAELKLAQDGVFKIHVLSNVHVHNLRSGVPYIFCRGG